MQPAPVYFQHGNRIVRGSIVNRRLANHRVKVQAQCYVLPNGEDQPIPLDFFSVLKHTEFTTDAASMLALVEPSKDWVKFQKRSA